MLLLVASEYPSLPPAISAAVTILLLPVFVGGITLMVQRHKAGEQILADEVFAGFQQNAGQQMGVGLLALLYLGLLALGLFLLRSSWPEAFAHSGGRIGLGLGALFLTGFSGMIRSSAWKPGYQLGRKIAVDLFL